MRRSARSKRNVLLWILSLIIIVSMVCGLIISIAGNGPAREPTPASTPTVERATPTRTATLAGPQPSPQPLATSAQ